MIVKAKIRDENSEWVEEFVIPDGENDEEYIKKVIDNFNSTLKPYEKPREFVEIVQDKDITKWEDKEVFREFYKLLQKWILQLSHENSNIYGNAWVKHKFERKIIDFINECPISIDYTNDLKKFANELLKRGWRKYKKWLNEV